MLHRGPAQKSLTPERSDSPERISWRLGSARAADHAIMPQTQQPAERIGGLLQEVLTYRLAVAEIIRPTWLWRKVRLLRRRACHRVPLESGGIVRWLHFRSWTVEILPFVALPVELLRIHGLSTLDRLPLNLHVALRRPVHRSVPRRVELLRIHERSILDRLPLNLHFALRRPVHHRVTRRIDVVVDPHVAVIDRDIPIDSGGGPPPVVPVAIVVDVDAAIDPCAPPYFVVH